MTSGGHAADISEDGLIRMPIACFLVRTSDLTILIDAGIGPRELCWQRGNGDDLTLRGGALPGALGDLGLTPADIDYVLPTHLHHDHAGWLVLDGEPFFPNATLRFGAGDWEPWVTNSLDPAFRSGMEMLRANGRIDLIERDGALFPGVNSLGTPGHTPGHQTFLLSSGESRALILGDAVSCPLQIEFSEREAIADADRELGRLTREKILRELEGTETLVSGPHFPELRFGRVMMGKGRRYWL